MIEFKTFCYLQNQKTGCTFVESFLREHSSEPVVAYEKHVPVSKRKPGMFYFINVREPIALYRSLYAYGLDGRGTVFVRLKALGHESLYAKGKEGFPDWLSVILNPKNAKALSGMYTPEVAQVCGFMTWRFLRLAAFGFEKAAPGFGTRKELNDFVREKFFMNAVLKQESLREDLAQLVRGPLASRVKDANQALAWIGETPPINASASMSGSDDVPVDEALMRRVFAKERRLYNNFYPEAPGFAEWKSSRKTS